MPAVHTQRMTARQFRQLGEDPDGIRLELVDGEIEMSPSPRRPHAYTLHSLSALLFNHVEKNDLGRIYGDLDTLIDPHNVRRPDIMFFSKARLHLIGDMDEQGGVGPPDLAVEIVSPSSVRIDREIKFGQYAHRGIEHYWIVDPQEQALDAFTLAGEAYEPKASGRGDDVVHAPPFPELDMPLSRLWEPGV